MKLERWMSIMNTPRLEGKYTYYNTKDRYDGSSNFLSSLTVSFEMPVTSKIKEEQKVVHRSSSSQKSPTILKSNPISMFLTDEVGTTTKPVSNKATTKSKPLKTTNTLPCMINKWSMHEIAPIIEWLEEKKIRYIYADWECTITNGERTRIVSQHGQVVNENNILESAEYVCSSAFSNLLHTRIRRAHYSNETTLPDFDWWTHGKAGTVVKLSDGRVRHTPMPNPIIPSETCAKKSDVDTVLSLYENGIYMHVRQHRIYKWDDNTTIHLSTVDGKGYRIWLEYNGHTSPESLKSFSNLFVQISYHLSFYGKSKLRR